MTKWLWNPHVGKLGKNIMGVGVRKIIEQMGRANPNNWMKTVTLEIGWPWHQIEGVTNIHL
jgi:hypothetical protein